ncbi:hypothetical protein CRENBAI_008281 [Crenichthys baileyi]|uniref:Uncharacterized protein n=1 Tax=Crenichthys baileyi TaxID=28760 RepID=A0AAV9SQX4_9TELE
MEKEEKKGGGADTVRRSALKATEEPARIEREYHVPTMETSEKELFFSRLFMCPSPSHFNLFLLLQVTSPPPPVLLFLTPLSSGTAPNTYTPMNTHSLSRPGFENTNPNQHYHLESDEPRGRQNQVDSKSTDCGQKFYFVGGFYRGEGRSEQHVTLEIFDILARNSGKKLKKLKQL